MNAGFTSLIIESDNANVIQAISSSISNRFILGCVVDDICHLIHRLYWTRTNQMRIYFGQKILLHLPRRVSLL